jgi:signal transduction histidine kinase
MGSFVAGMIAGSVAAAVIAWRQQRRKSRYTAEVQTQAFQSERLAELGRLTGGLAHEIRTPISTMKVNLQLLAEDLRSAAGSQDFQDNRRRHLARIETLESEADRLKDILDDFLKYAGRYEIDPTSRDLNDVIGSILDFIEPELTEAGIRLRRSQTDSRLPCRLDEDFIKQAVLNVISNAQQMMEKGGDLIVRTDRRERDASVEIADTGPGILPDDLPRIFDVFYSTRRGGTGLGLPIARRIILEHGGEMEVHSESGVGTSFLIRLPLELGA